MDQLYFYYSAMNADKSISLLQSAFTHIWASRQSRRSVLFSQLALLPITVVAAAINTNPPSQPDLDDRKINSISTSYTYFDIKIQGSTALSTSNAYNFIKTVAL
jgi:hypothetical protein